MKILFGIQGTGNGHLAQAREIIPFLKQHGEVDLLVSGIESEYKLPYPLKYQKHGLGFIFGQKGGIDFKKSFQTMKLIQLVKDIRGLDVTSYDLVISDFEMLTSWACKLRGMPCHGMSHLSVFLSNKIPTPKYRRRWVEFILKNYAPTKTMDAFHYAEYDSFIHTPIIRQEIRNVVTTEENHVTVYLPAVSDKFLISVLSKVKETTWKVFSKRTNKIYTEQNVTIYPISNEDWIKALSSGEGVLIGAGFNGTAEALFLGKKLLVIPMFMQYEQECNAAALEEIGVRISWKITKHLEDEIRDWLKNDKIISVNYPDKTGAIVKNIIDNC